MKKKAAEEERRCMVVVILFTPPFLSPMMNLSKHKKCIGRNGIYQSKQQLHFVGGTVEGIIKLKAGFLKQQLHCVGGRDYQIRSWLSKIGIPIHRIVGSETKSFVPLEFKGTINIF